MPNEPPERDPIDPFGPDADGPASGEEPALGLTDEAPGRYQSGKELGRGGIGAVQATFDAHPAGAWSVAFSPDGRVLAMGGDNGDLHLWDPQSGRVRATLPGHGTSAVWGLAFSPDGATLASAAGNGEIRLWTTAALDTPAAQAEAEARAHLGPDPLREVGAAAR